MLTAIGIFSGIDLLTWTVTGNVEDGLPGRRAYTEFFVDYGGLSQTDAEILYQFRCAQTHSYGLYTIDLATGSKKAGIKPTAYGFTITTGSQVRTLVQPLAGRTNHFVIGFWEFKELFLRCFGELQRRLRDSSTPEHAALINNFHQATEKIGFIDCT